LALALLLYASAEKVVLSVTGAAPLAREDQPQLYSITRGMASWAGLPTPGLYIIHETQPNAFVLGRGGRRTAIVLTDGLLDAMDLEEVKGVIAHGLAHIKQGDGRWSTFASALAAAFIFMVQGRGAGRPKPPRSSISLFAPLLHLSSTGGQDERADLLAAKLAGRPDGLIRALRKAGPAVPRGRINRWHLPLYLSQPLVPLRQMIRFNPRPDMEERIQRLSSLI
ncbi:MAG: Heat shock protein, partial [Symbiobacteriaceae bacterium]|nr:Heat shock protein [Symbiobacteriaceae bacterium]